MFESIGGNLKKISKVLFYICCVCGGFVLIIGLFRFLGSINNGVSFSEALECTLEDAVKWKSLYEDAYYGKMQMKTGFWFMISAFSMLPMYALGELVCSCQEIRKNAAEHLS